MRQTEYRDKMMTTINLDNKNIMDVVNEVIGTAQIVAANDLAEVTTTNEDLIVPKSDRNLLMYLKNPLLAQE